MIESRILFVSMRDFTRILIVDDNHGLRHNLMTVLMAEGYRPLAVDSGERALRMSREIRPDLILCDISMKGMDGFEVLEALKGETESQSIPFIFITAQSARERAGLAMKKGAADYLTKPFTSKELLTSIQAVLGQPGPRAAPRGNSLHA